ncbi:MAG: hypothetical protein QOG52_245 [Frankiaceae bacterium]|nr:hypothetical protein [Frankiaceae bacterium]
MRVLAVITFRRACRLVVPLTILAWLVTTPSFTASASVVDPAGTVQLGADESVPARTTIVGASDEWVAYGTGSTYNATSLLDERTVALSSHGDVPRLTGSMVVVAHVDQLEWTDLDTGEGGAAAFPQNTFGGATPSGWVLRTGATGLEFVDARSGAVTAVGLPVGSYVNDWQLRTGPLGVYVSPRNTSSNLYVTYAHPQMSSTLSASAQCALTAVEAVCGGYQNVHVLPLDGSSGSVWATSAGFVAATATRVGWIDYRGTFHTADPDGRNQRTAKSSIDVQAATANGFLYVGGSSADDSGIYRLTDVGEAPTLVVALGGGTLRAQAMAIGVGRVAWVDDASATAAVWSQAVHGTGGAVGLGMRQSVNARTSDWLRTQGAFVAVSGRRTVYGDSTDVDLYDGVHTLRVLSTTRPIGLLQLSGTRLLFDRLAVTTIIDVRTRAALFTGKGMVTPVLWGDYVAYGRMNGAVVRRNLVTGQTVEALPPPKDGFGSLTVRLHGDYVAWEASLSVAYRNLRTHALFRVPAGETLVALSGTGILTARVSGRAATLVFRRYGSSAATTITTGDQGLLSAVAEGSVVAWIDGKGLPKVAALPGGDGRPQLLGGATAPRTMTGARTWTGEWNASAPLTSCSVQLVYGRTTIRTLPCDAAGMAVGVATVSWDGRDAAGRSINGGIAWRLVAANRGGTILAEDGSATTVHGIVTASVASG